MKKVFKSREVAHIWAQQKQEEGRNAQGNIYFKGKSIFSYGSHFEMARFISSDIIFRTTRRYSVTTAKQLGYVGGALSGSQTLFDVPSFEDHTENALYLAKEVRALIDETSRARTSIGYRLQQLSGKTKDARAYLESFRKKIKAPARKEIRDLNRYFHKVLTQDKIDEIKRRAAEKERLDKIRYEERRRIAALEESERLELWKAGAFTGSSYFRNSPLTLRIQQDRIETTKGASIPLLAARELWDKLQRREPVHGLALGDYTVTAFDGSMLTVGCHQIPVKEILRMAQALEWTKEATI